MKAEQKSLPEKQIRKLGLVYNIYRIITSAFLFISSHALIFINYNSSFELPSFLHQTILLFYWLFSLLLLAFFLITHSNYNNQFALGLLLDIVVLSILLYINGGLDIQLMILYMVVVAVSFILIIPYQAAIITMLAVIFVIYQQFFQALTTTIDFRSLVEACLMAVSFICVGVLSWLISQRLITVENIAEKNALQISKLNAITHEVISNMQQGILVFDADKNIMIINRATSIFLNLNLSKPQKKSAKSVAKHIETDKLYYSNDVVKKAIIHQHPMLINWINSFSSNNPSKLIYPLPNPTATLDKLRLTTTALQDGIVLVLIEDLRREQTNAQQLKLASLGQLTASIAHEIRNPLATISQASQLLMDEEDWGDKQAIAEQESDPNIELYRMIFEQTKRVNRIIEDVLKLSRQAKPAQSKLEIVPWLEQFIDNYYHKNDVVLQTEISPNLYFDPHQLEQILINLINNGLRFSRKIQPDAFVEIELFLQENDVILDVLDNGSGVAVEKQENLFMPFFTTDNDGTGLGLYLSQAFAEANFARLLYVANHKKTCFRLIIPQAMSDEIE